MNLLIVEYLVDRDLTFFGVLESRQAFDDRALDPLGLLARLDNATGLTAFLVDVDPGESERVGLGAAPVHVLEPVSALGRTVLEVEHSLLPQPGVQIHPAAERLEAVIGDHEEEVLRAELLHHALDHGVRALVHLENGVLVLLDVLPRVRGMILLQVAEEHVLQAVRPIEDARPHALAGLVQRVEEHGFALLVVIQRLLEKRLLVDHPLVQRPGVLGQPERGERPDQLGEIHGVVARERDRQRGLAGVDIDRRDVEPELRRHLRDVEARDALSRNPEARLELEPDPGRVLPLLEEVLLAADLELRLSPLAIELEGEGDLHRASVGAEGVHWARERGMDPVVLDRHRDIGRHERKDAHVAALRTHHAHPRREIKRRPRLQLDGSIGHGQPSLP